MPNVKNKEKGREIPLSIVVLCVIISAIIISDVFFLPMNIENAVVLKKLEHFSQMHRSIYDPKLEVFTVGKGVYRIHISKKLLHELNAGDPIEIHYSTIIGRVNAVKVNDVFIQNRNSWYVLYLGIAAICLIPLFGIIFGLENIEYVKPNEDL